ncbi:hypothetical protein SDC9_67923 [bioreactor metagenome]|uniref:Phage protein n=1 Tax=bioreactor metagenome TaxID=1076179 RepID=A0A644XZE5_9ZZZZ
MKNKLSDLNNHLFLQLERLGDEDLTGEQLSEEITRAKAVTGLASQIIANGTLVLKAVQMTQEYPDGNKAMPKMLTGESDGV